MRDRRDKTFEAVVGAVGRALSAGAGWKEDEAERVLNGRRFVRDLDSLLSLAVDLLFDTDEETGSHVLGGVVAVRCPAAQEVLDGLHSPANAAIERILLTDAQEELAIELSPELPVSDTARMVTALVRKATTALAAEAGTVDDFLRCMAIDRYQADRADRSPRRCWPSAGVSRTRVRWWLDRTRHLTPSSLCASPRGWPVISWPPTPSLWS